MIDENNSKIVKEEIVRYINKMQPVCSGDLGVLQLDSLKKGIPIIDRETAKFLEMFLSIHKPAKILEVGCAVGFSASLFYKTLKGNTKITTIDRFPLMIEKAKKNFKKLGIDDKITILEGDAKDILPTLEGKYDFIFLDSSKGQYIKIVNDCLRLLKIGGVLIADDIFQRGNVTKKIEEIPKRQRTIHRRLNEFIYEMSNNKDLTSSLVPIGDGILICIKNDEVVIGVKNEK